MKRTHVALTAYDGQGGAYTPPNILGIQSHGECDTLKCASLAEAQQLEG